MIDESKLIFYTGAPGSKWSAAAHLLSKSRILDINTSDYRDDRSYTHSKFNVSHHGAYWGPGNGIGEDFHILDTLSKDEILDEIDHAYADKNSSQYRIIKSHHFSMHLEFIRETFPTSKILIILRPNLLCYNGWMSAGGFDKITYPNYSKFYINPQRMEDMITVENQGSKEFIRYHNLTLNPLTESYWKSRWDVDSSESEASRYIESIEYGNYKSSRILTYDTYAAEYNF